MQPTSFGIKSRGDLGGEKILTRFDEDSIEFIMSVLTDLYSDPELAVIREYSTNAYDSHVEAGNSQPIEVTTPTNLSPYFRVKDYGLGMSLDDIRQTYSAYGASTKRESDAVVGMLGLGSKSAWTYTAQFNIIAVKDGVKATVSATRTDTGRTMLEIVDTCATDEPNSVEIIVPTKSNNSFEYKAKNFFRFWPTGSVLLNGAEPERIKGDSVGPRMIVVDGLDNDYVVMGHVAYPVTGRINPIYASHGGGYGVVATVEIGDVSFVPSREALNYNGHTKATIKSLQEEFSATMKATVQKDIDAAANHGEAMTRWTRWVSRLGPLAREASYKGTKVETSWNVQRLIVWHPHRSRNALETRKYSSRVEFESLNKHMVIVNFSSDKLSTYQRQKVRAWAESKGMPLPQYVYIFDGAIPGSPWTDNVEVIDWAIIKAFKIPSSGGSRQMATGYRFSVVGQNGWEDTDTLDTGLEIVYFSKADENEGDIGRSMRDLVDEVQVVSLTRNRWDKFKRDFPTSRPLSEYLRDRVKEAAKALSEEDKVILGFEYYEKSNLARLDETIINDPVIARYVRLAKSEPKDSPALKAFLVEQNRASPVIGRMTFETTKISWGKYPLLNIGGYRIPKGHNELYMNAVYAHEQEKAQAKAMAEAEAAMVENIFPQPLDSETAA